jgi:hypothetical protein
MEGIDDPAAARVILDEPQTRYANDMLEVLRMSITRKLGWEEARDTLLAKVRGKS